jgi:parallel beta-helix repeat protein
LNDKAVALVSFIMLSISMFGFLGFAAAYPDGLVIINADGTIQGTDAIQQIGNVYALTGDINVGGDYKYAGVQVLRDNIVLDGAGFSLATVESGNIGVDLTDRNNVTVENFFISGFKQGVFLGNSTGNSISNNTITGYTGSSPCVGMGIWVDLSSHNNRIISNYVASNSWGGIVVEAASSYNWIEGNILVNNEVGIGLSYCPYNTLRNNKMLGNNDSLQLAYNTREQFTQTIDSSNTIEGKPVYYWIGEHDKVVPSNAGYIALGDCSNITVEGLQISHGSISICNTVNSTVKNNNLHNCDTGINVQFCDSIEITENNVTNSKIYGISIGSSSNIDIFKNHLDSCAEGISTFRSPVSQVITIINNEITKNSCGIHLVYGQKNLIFQNDFLENGLGINFVSCSYNNITENNFQSNNGPSVRLSGFSNNTFYHNNFIYNSKDGSQALNPWITSTPGAGPNVWDNGVEGNYWNDMLTRYPNVTQIAGGKVWDTSYIINDANIDHYPLVQPYQSSQPTQPYQTPQVTDTYAPNTVANSDYPQVNQQNQTSGNLLIAASVTASVACAAIGITYFALRRLRKP